MSDHTPLTPSPSTTPPKKTLLYSLLSPPYPSKPRCHIHFRADSLSLYNNLGVLFVIEKWDGSDAYVQNVSSSASISPIVSIPTPAPSSSSSKYLIWIAYETLQIINPRHVVHMKSNGELVNKVRVRESAPPPDYVSAKLSASQEQHEIQQQMQHDATLPISMHELDAIAKINMAIVMPLHELHSIEVDQKMYGWSSIKLRQVTGANLSASGSNFTGSNVSSNSTTSTSEKKKSWGPLIFQDGGLQTFLDQLECHMQFYRMPHNNTIFVKEKSHSLDKSVRLMEFDDYFSDVLREEGALSGMTSSATRAPAGGLMEWGAKLSKEVNNLQVGLKKYFGGNNKEQQAKEALERLKAERQRTRLGSSIDQKIILNPAEEDNAEEIGLAEEDDDFEIIDPVKENLVPPEWNNDPSKSISLQEWHSKWLDAKTGVVKNYTQLKREVFYRGIQEEARAEIWPFLLGFYPWDSTREEREQLLKDSADEYKVYRTQWESITPRQMEKHSVFRERSHRVEKDVVRTDRTNPLYAADDSPYLQIIYRVLVTYAFYNFDLGYCQGMGDFLSPLLSVTRDETLTYWCYSTLMDSRVHQNFHKDSKGMEAQLQSLLNIVKTLDYGLYVYLESRDALNLFFCFRWILVNFKREFSYDDIKRIWESFWTNEWGENMHLFMCYAILHQHRDTFMQKQMGFDEILQFCVDLNLKMDAEQVVRKTLFAILEYKRMLASSGLHQAEGAQQQLQHGNGVQ